MSVIANNIVAGAAGQGGTDAAYQIDRSLRFNSADSAYLSRGSFANSDTKTMTFSFWLKRSAPTSVTATQYVFSGGDNGTIFFSSSFSDKLSFNLRGTSGTNFFTNTEAELRDFSAWYHIVVALDLDNATTSERFKCYINGVLQTMSSTNYPNNNFHDGGTWYIGSYTGTQHYPDFYLADFYYIAGQALDPTDFGEFDANNVWQPKAYSGTYGTNGFHLPFSDNSSNAALGTDSSGNNNDWTVNNLVASAPSTLDAVDFTSSSTRLLVPSSADFNLGSNWTLEFFFENRSTAATRLYYFDNNAQNIQTDNNGTRLLYFNGSNAYTFGSISLNQSYHLALVNNGGTVTAYLDGVATSTFPAGSSATRALYIGAFSGGQNAFNGKISNFRIVNGTSVYTSNFTPPTSNLSNVTNTVLLCCQSSSSVTAATVTPGTITAFGTPTVSSLLVGDGGNQDSLVDSPTNGTQTDTGAGGEVVGNYATLNPLDNTATLSNGNLDFSASSSESATATIAIPSSGKWYFEATVTKQTSGSVGFGVGISPDNVRANSFIFNGSSTIYTEEQGTQTAYQSNPFYVGDVIGVLVNADSSSISYTLNNVALGASHTYTYSGQHFPFIRGLSSTGVINFGQRPFAYTAPSGFKALCTTNLEPPTIADGSTVMDVVTYSGDGSSSRSITGLNFNPDLVWVKVRYSASFTESHVLSDSVRGPNKQLFSNLTSAEGSQTNEIQAFNSDGFDVGSNGRTNYNGFTYVAWAWDGGSSTVTNTDGSITSSVRANASAGFSVVTYTGNGSSGATIGHGLGVAPDLVIAKRRSSANNWWVYHRSLGGTKYLVLDLTNAAGTANTIWNDTNPSSTVVTLGGGESNTNTSTYVAYCFAPVDGYSSFGSYTGNGSATDGPFVYTGFRPKFILIKATSVSGSWVIWDTSRDSYNVMDSVLFPNLSNAETSASTVYVDALSNGFKLKNTNTALNQSSQSYIYACFCEHPFKTARAR